jgi:hypothetical protein
MSGLSAAGLVILSALAVGNMEAAYIVPPYTGTFDGITNLNSITLTLASPLPNPASPANITVGDVRGTAVLVETAPPGLALLYSGAPAVPNALELALNSTVTQSVLLEFNLIPSALDFAGGSLEGPVSVAVTGVPLTSVTDTALTALLGQTSFVFDYDQIDSSPDRGVLVYGLASINPVPEPGFRVTIFLLTFAMVVFSIRNRWRKRGRLTFVVQK